MISSRHNSLHVSDPSMVNMMNLPACHRLDSITTQTERIKWQGGMKPQNKAINHGHVSLHRSRFRPSLFTISIICIRAQIEYAPLAARFQKNLANRVKRHCIKPRYSRMLGRRLQYPFKHKHLHTPHLFRCRVLLVSGDELSRHSCARGYRQVLPGQLCSGVA